MLRPSPPEDSPRRKSYADFWMTTGLSHRGRSSGITPRSSSHFGHGRPDPLGKFSMSGVLDRHPKCAAIEHFLWVFFRLRSRVIQGNSKSDGLCFSHAPTTEVKRASDCKLHPEISRACTLKRQWSISSSPLQSKKEKKNRPALSRMSWWEWKAIRRPGYLTNLTHP